MATYTGVYNCGAPANITTDADVVSAFTVNATNNPTGLRAWNEASVLLDQLGAPKNDRRVVLSAFDSGAALINAPFLKANERGDQGGIVDGQIGFKLGMDWWMDQAIPTHTGGTLSDTATQTLTCPTAAVGVTAITFVGTITTACFFLATMTRHPIAVLPLPVGARITPRGCSNAASTASSWYQRSSMSTRSYGGRSGFSSWPC